MEWPNEQKITPGPYVKGGIWKVAILRDFMCDAILSGRAVFQKVKYERIFKTGKHKRSKNNDPQTKYHPELAHMTREEQESMLRVLGWMINLGQKKQEKPNRRRGVPRGRSLWPGQAAKCSCDGDMHLMGAYLRCENAQPRTSGVAGVTFKCRSIGAKGVAGVVADIHRNGAGETGLDGRRDLDGLSADASAKDPP